MEPEALTSACKNVRIPIHSNKLTAEEFLLWHKRVILVEKESMP